MFRALGRVVSPPPRAKDGAESPAKRIATAEAILPTAPASPVPPWHRLGPPLFYLAVTLIFLLPLPLHFTDTTIRVKSDDVWEHIWWIWWVREALTTGRSPYLTDLLFHPTGAPLYLMGMDMTTAVLSIPLQPLLGLVPTYNLLIVLATTFGAWAAYLLALDVTGSRPGALVAGTVFGFTPLLSSVTNMGQMEYTNIGFLPLAILFLLRLRRDDHPGALRRTILPGGVVLALAIYSSWYQGLFLFLFGLVFVAYESAGLLRGKRWREGRAFAGRLAAWGGIAIVLVAPGLLPAMRLAAGSDFAETPRAWIALSGLNLLDPFKPNALNPLFGGGEERLSYAVGYVATALAALGTVVGGRRARFWIIVIAVFYLLALGPFLMIGGRRWDLAILPYNWLYALPFGNIARAPVRFLFLIAIAQAILAAWGVAWLRERLVRPGARGAIAPRRAAILRAVAVALPLALVLLEWLPAPRGLAATAIHPFYRELAAEPPGAVYVLPYDTITPSMYWATAHRRPIIGGYISRHVPYPLLGEVPVVEQLRVRTDAAIRELTEPDIVDQPPPAGRGVDLLDAYGIRFVVLHRDVVTRPETARLEAALARVLPAEAVVFDDGTVRAWRVPRAARSGVVAGFGSGWYEMERRADSGQRFRWAKGDATMSLSLLDGSPRVARFSAISFGYERPTEVEVLLNDTVVGTVAVGLAPQPLAFDLPLQAGYNALRFRAREAPLRPIDVNGTRDDRPLSFALADVRITLP